MNKIKSILAVDPGSRYLGVAVMESNQLVYYGVKRIKTNQPAWKRIAEAKRIIQKLIDFYQPHVLAIEKPLPHWSKQSKLLNKICEVIKGMAKENKLRAREFTPKQIRKVVCGNPKATREKIVEILKQKYPEWEFVLNEKKIRNRYWNHVFAALAIGKKLTS